MKPIKFSILSSIIVILSLFIISCTIKDEKFSNLEPFADKSLWDVIKWQLTGEQVDWPQWKDYPQYSLDRARVTGDDLSFAVINHATILIQWRGMNIITDPIYAERASPFTWIGPKRVRAPGIAFDELPVIDVILISHNHYDHLDLETLSRLQRRDDPLILLGLNNGQLLTDSGIDNYQEMDWWDSIQLNSLNFHFVPAQHWSSRGIFDHRETLWGGFSITDPAGKHLYFAGDTGYGSFFTRIKHKYGPPDLAFIPIGAYEPRWFMQQQHLNPQDALMAHQDLHSRYSVGIHFETFQLTDEAFQQPRSTLTEEWQAGKYQGRFLVPTFGKQYFMEDFSK